MGRGWYNGGGRATALPVVRTGAKEQMRYDLLAVNLAAMAAAVIVLCFYGLITLLAIMSLYVLTSSTPFDIDFPVSFLNAGPAGIVLSIGCAVWGMLGALACALRLRIIGWALTGITVAVFMVMIASPLLFAALI